jgi:hypothetical protein
MVRRSVRFVRLEFRRASRLENDEIGLALRVDGVSVNIGNGGMVGAVPEPIQQRIDVGFWAFEFRFHRTVEPVTHPPVDAETLRFCSSPIAEPDTLHGSVHNHVFADHGSIVTRLQRTVTFATHGRFVAREA